MSNNYTTLANGLQICWGGNSTSSNTYVVTAFPKAFKATPIVVATMALDASLYYGVVITTITSTNFHARGWYIHSANPTSCGPGANLPFKYIAIGK